MNKTIIYVALFFLSFTSISYAGYEFELKGETIDFSDKAENMGILAQGRGDKPCKIDIAFVDSKNLALAAKAKPLYISLSIKGGLKSGTYPFYKSKSTSMGSKWFAKNTEQVLITWQNGKGTKAKQFGGYEGTLTIERDGMNVKGLIEGKMADYTIEPDGKLKSNGLIDIKGKFNHQLETNYKKGGMGNVYFCKEKKT